MVKFCNKDKNCMVIYLICFGWEGQALQLTLINEVIEEYKRRQDTTRHILATSVNVVASSKAPGIYDTMKDSREVRVHMEKLIVEINIDNAQKKTIRRFYSARS
jgi:hypothetical protein